jgi:hypothetical protein
VFSALSCNVINRTRRRVDFAAPACDTSETRIAGGVINDVNYIYQSRDLAVSTRRLPDFIMKFS